MFDSRGGDPTKLQNEQKVQVGGDAVRAKGKINTLVTATHIGVTLAYTITHLIFNFFKTYLQD